MGQSSSHELSSAPPATHGGGDDDGKVGGGIGGSGVTISPDLEGTFVVVSIRGLGSKPLATRISSLLSHLSPLRSYFSFLPTRFTLAADIVRDFTNQTVQDEWTKFRAGVLNRQHERSTQLSRRAQAQEQERQVAAAQRQQRIQVWDARMDHLNAQFSDMSVALEHDAKALYRKFEESGTVVVVDPATKASSTSTSVPCLGPRAHWMDCAIKYQVDTRPCDAYLATLERCVQETVVRLAQGSHAAASSSPPQANAIE